MKCKECGTEFSRHSELEAHEDEHRVRTVSKEPLVMLLTLPDGCDPGRWEAAESFAEAVKELRQKFPENDFQLLPFSFVDGRLEAILAVEK